MSYQVIARKWRPQSFDQLVGQTHISQTLANALKNQRLPHALLFTGPRGTGKTSSARILAKNLRCPNAVDFVACNTCESCIEIAQGNSVDVMEIDGASNNGVDAIRELRSTVAFMPTSGKLKIYIIDEVHMLSTSAFNALLKTLEEPPDHVIFIMATTDPHKIPQTVLSRCQRFDFRSIPTRQISERLEQICKSDSVQADPEALWIVARQGAGSMRDAQSLLDQVITFANGELTREKVIDILGLTDRSLLLDTLNALIYRDTSQMLPVIEKISTAGYEASLFAQDLLEMIRHLLLIKISSAETPILELPDSELRHLKELGQHCTEEDLHMLFDMALKGAHELPRSQEPRIVLEMLLLRMSAAPYIQNIRALLSGSGSDITTAPANRPAPAPARPATTSANKPATRAIELPPHERWLAFVQKMRNADALFAAKIEGILFSGLKDKLIELSIPKKLSFLKDQLGQAENQQKLQSMIDQHWGPGYTFNIVTGKEEGASAQDLAQKKVEAREEEIAKQIADHPLIKTAQEVFKAKIKAIRETHPNQGIRK